MNAPNETERGFARRNQLRLADRQQLDEHAGKLHDAVMRAPRMPVARADREAEPRIGLAHRVEVVHRMHDMVETARNDCLPSLVCVYAAAERQRSAADIGEETP